MLNYLNEHFISAGSLFESLNPDQTKLVFHNEEETINSQNDLSFNFSPVSASEVQSALRGLDLRKAAGPDGLDPFFLKLAADFIADPLSYIFNLSLTTNKLPKVWKSAFVLPLLKGGKPSEVNNYRPISKLCILAKVFERLVSDQLKEFLDFNNILSPFQSGFRKRHSTVTAALMVLNDFIHALDCTFY